MLASFLDLFAAFDVLLLGALTGLVFGFLLQKGGVTDYNVIVGQFLLRDFTMIKIMLSAVVTGAIGIYGMRSLGFDIGLHVKAAAVLGNLLGGAIFGIGMVVLGYCPGTGVAALGDGRKDATPGLLGMLVGAGLYAEVEPWLAEHVLQVANLGKVTLPGLLGVSPAWIVIGLTVVVAGALIKLEGWERSRRA